MRVVFVARAKGEQTEVVPFIRAQGESLRRIGVDVHYFPIVGSGLSAYRRAVPRLKQWLKENPVDVVHAHYTLSGWSAVLARPRQPVVLSLMGTDAYGEYIGYRKVTLSSRYLTLLTFLIQPFVDRLVCKSANIAAYSFLKQKTYIVPNGVRLKQFVRQERDAARAALGLDPHRRYVLFLGDPGNPRKNVDLVRQAVDSLGREDVVLLNPYPVDHDMVVRYLNASDVLAVASFMEGSPNVVKEAMACDCPLVVTDVGDAAWVVGKEPGCYVSTFNMDDYARQLSRALQFGEGGRRTNGRSRLLSLGLDARQVALRLEGIYEELISQPPSAATSPNGSLKTYVD